jgi:two-component system sensor histidine kinase GlrK
MKIATRIISGYGILILLLASVLTYQVIAVHRMRSINRTMAGVNFHAALASLQLMRDLDLVEEYTKKALLLGDQDYHEQLQTSRDNFTATLEDLRAHTSSERERAEVERLAEFWRALLQDVSELPRASPAEPVANFPPGLQDHFDRIQAQGFTVYQRVLHSISADADTLRRTGDRMETLAWIAAAMALVLSALVSFLIVRSISLPLRHLTEGTRAIAAGKFYYRLDTSGRDEFAQVARDFNVMTLRLGELNVMKKAFVSHVSHELKAPLASMREIAQLMLEQIPGSLNDKQKRLLELNLQSNRRLTSIIGNLLDISKMEAGVMEYDLKEQGLNALVNTAIAEYEPQANEKDIKIEKEMPSAALILECDGDRIIQVIGNVLGNAVKFSPRSGTIRVTVAEVPGTPAGMPPKWRDALSLHPRGRFAQITVADSGPGIPDEHKDTVFEKFFQANPGKKRSGEGVGLGLAISQTVIEAHRGAIWIEDNPAGGSVFHLLLRLETDAVQASAAARD